VQTAPTPARTCGTARPTNGTRVVTLAPDWPVAGSIAQSENVEYCGRPSSLIATPSAARCCAEAVECRAMPAHVMTTAIRNPQPAIRNPQSAIDF
jgi:hypothetical protein